MSSQPSAPDAVLPADMSADAAEPTVVAAAVTVVSGRPTAEEVAALVAVLTAVGGEQPAPPRPRRSAWSDPAWRLVGPAARPQGWRTSALPR